MLYQKALVPLDGSDLAECALSHVKNLLKDGCVGEVTLLTVVGIDRKDFFDKAKEHLANVKAKLSADAGKVKVEALYGNIAADCISEYAQKNGTDIIIIATHGSSGLTKIMLGSVASSVLQKSHVPVLLIRPEACFI
jgi:nucleotide-binding universal stress UspA family protein